MSTENVQSWVGVLAALGDLQEACVCFCVWPRLDFRVCLIHVSQVNRKIPSVRFLQLFERILFHSFIVINLVIGNVAGLPEENYSTHMFTRSFDV